MFHIFNRSSRCQSAQIEVRANSRSLLRDLRNGDGESSMSFEKSTRGIGIEISPIWLCGRNAKRGLAQKLSCLIIATAYGWTHPFWFDSGHGDAGVLCAGRSQPLVHPGICRCVRVRLDLWVSSGCLAFWIGGGDMVSRGRAALVVAKILAAIHHGAGASSMSLGKSARWKRWLQTIRRPPRRSEGDDGQPVDRRQPVVRACLLRQP